MSELKNLNELLSKAREDSVKDLMSNKIPILRENMWSCISRYDKLMTLYSQNSHNDPKNCKVVASKKKLALPKSAMLAGAAIIYKHKSHGNSPLPSDKCDNRRTFDFCKLSLLEEYEGNKSPSYPLSWMVQQEERALRIFGRMYQKSFTQDSQYSPL